MKVKSYSKQTCKLVLFLVLGYAGLSNANEQDDIQLVHWAYSSFFGTGWYEIEDNRSVFVIRVPPRQVLRESGIDDSGKRKLGIEVHYPLTMGVHDIDDLPGVVHPDNFGTISFTPGVELEIPINQRWYLRSFAHVGWGTELDTGDSAWIYYTGIKSRYTFPGRKFDWALLNSLYYTGYTPDKGRSDRLAVAQLGVKFRQPLDATLAGRAIDLDYHFIYSFLGDELHFGLPDGTFDPVEDQFEVEIAMRFRGRPYKLWFFKLRYLGLGYKFSSDGQFRAITLSMRPWFTK
jgi:hypothetical protein